jgi:hypothetical protein
MLFIINARLIFPLEEFLQRNGPKQSKICTLTARNIFLVFEKENVFLKIKKEHSTKK